MRLHTAATAGHWGMHQCSFGTVNPGTDASLERDMATKMILDCDPEIDVEGDGNARVAMEIDVAGFWELTLGAFRRVAAGMSA